MDSTPHPHLAVSRLHFYSFFITQFLSLMGFVIWAVNDHANVWNEINNTKAITARNNEMIIKINDIGTIPITLRLDELREQLQRLEKSINDIKTIERTSKHVQ